MYEHLPFPNWMRFMQMLDYFLNTQLYLKAFIKKNCKNQKFQAVTAKWIRRTYDAYFLIAEDL